jgi:hypothetical protein
MERDNDTGIPITLEQGERGCATKPTRMGQPIEILHWSVRTAEKALAASLGAHLSTVEDLPPALQRRLTGFHKAPADHHI